MTASAFDTLTTARALEAAGIERRQAEAIAEGMRRAIRKADLAELRAATRADLYRALWIQAAAFALIVLIVAAGTGVIVLRAIAPSPAVAALQAHPGTATSRATTDPGWWGPATCTFSTGSPNSRHSWLRGQRCLDGARALDPAWWGASTGRQAKTL